MAIQTGDPLIGRKRNQIRRTALTPYGVGTASYSTDLLYRFRLSRIWDTQLPRCAFLMLNPSTATELVLDPTVTRCMRAAQSWGYGSAEIINLFGYRATDPSQLRHVKDPVGVGNDIAILAAAADAELVVAAWGVHGAFGAREDHVVDLLAGKGFQLSCLGVTKSGAPRHPLYLPSGIIPQSWKQPRRST